MGQLPSYTLTELEDRSGFDKRTIAYYISEGLLPRVGRRGRNTRYPQEFLERLMFIRRVRDMQDDGELRAVTLNEIRDVMNELIPEEIRAGALESESVDWIREQFVNPDWDTTKLAVPAEQVAAAWDSMDFDSTDSQAAKKTSGMRKAARKKKSPRLVAASQRRDNLQSRVRVDEQVGEFEKMLSSPTANLERLQDESHRADELTDKLGELVKEVDQRARIASRSTKSDTREQLTRVPVTDNIILSVRNIDEKDAHLVEELAAMLRQASRRS